MPRKRLPDESMPGEEEVKIIEAKYESLEQDYDELQLSIRSLKQEAMRRTDKEKLLQEEVSFLERKYQMFTEKDHENRATDEPTSCESTRLQPLMSTTHHNSPEMVVTHALEQANKKRDLENNVLVSAQKPPKVKDGRKKKIKDLLVSPDCGAKSIIISKIPSEPAEALPMEDKSRRHELTRMQTFSSTNDCTLPEMVQTSSFKELHSSLVTPAVIGGRNVKTKAYASVSPEFLAKISRIPRKPTVGLGIEDEPTRHELMGMQPLSSTDEFTVPKMSLRSLKQKARRSKDKEKLLQEEVSFLQRKHQMLTENDHEDHAADEPASNELTRGQPLMSTTHHTSPEMVVSHALEQANKKRDLENNRLVSAQKPSKVKDGGKKKIKEDPSKVKDGRKNKIKEDLLVSPDCGAKRIIISKIPIQPIEALTMEDKSRRHELTRMQTFSSTYDCTLPKMVQTSSFKEPHSSLVTHAVIGGRNAKTKAYASLSPEFLAKISRIPREPAVGLGIEDEPARHELMGMRPLSSTCDFTVPKMSLRSLKQKARRSKDKEKLLQEEVSFLQRKYQMLTENDHEDHAADAPACHELTGGQPLMSTTHHTSLEMVVTHALEQANKKRDLENNGLVSAQKPSKVKDGGKKKIKEDPSKVKDGRKKKIKDLLVSPDCVAKKIIISKIPIQPAEALAMEDKSRRHELTRMQTFLSTDDCTLPEMVQTSSFKEPHSSLVTPAVIGGRNAKTKAYPSVSQEFLAKISRIPREPTVGLGIEDEPARHESMGMQPLSSTDDFTVPEMIALQPGTLPKMSDLKVPHGSLVTPTVKPANKKRRLVNSAQTSVQKPFNVKDGRNRKINPLVSPEFVARNISVSGRPKEPMEALPIEGETSRNEFTGMQPLLPTADYITWPQSSDMGMLTAIPVPHKPLLPTADYITWPQSSDMGILTAIPVPHKPLLPTADYITWPQSSDMGILTAIPVPHRSLATPNVEYGPGRHQLLDHFQSLYPCTSAEMTGRQRSDARTMSAITMLHSLLVTQPARHELQLFSPSDACTSTEITGGLQGSATRTMPAIANLQSSLVTPVVVRPAIANLQSPLATPVVRPAIANLQSSLVTPVVVRPAIANLQSSLVTPVVKEPAIEKRFLENNGLVTDQKPSKVKGSQRKKIKDNSRKPISLSNERDEEFFWDN